MLLRIGQVIGYNNLIVIATPGQKLGLNSDLNDTPVPPPPSIQIRASSPPPPASPAPTTTAADVAAAEQHQNEKTAMIVGFVAVGLLVLWLY
jgi:hypothetical protein